MRENGEQNTEQQNIPILLLRAVTPDLLLCAVILSFIATTATVIDEGSIKRRLEQRLTPAER